MSKDIKPLGAKAYGSIPHLPNSRMGPADHHCHDGQRVICCEKTRDKHDRIIVTEKLDGSCVSVANVNGEILAIGRAGYLANSSPYEHVIQFAEWVDGNKARFKHLIPGQRIVGEWLAMAHGTIYNLSHEPFVAFDLINGKLRRPHDEARNMFDLCGIPAAAVIHDGGAIAVDAVLDLLGPTGKHGATEIVEGAVWRVERKGEFDFLAKFVRPEKVDGKYFDQITGNGPVWLWSETTNEELVA